MSRPRIAVHRRTEAGAAFSAAAEAIARLASDPESPFHRQPAPGHLRGIDHFSARDLLHTLARGMHGFRLAHGRFPDLANPARCQEKLFWRRFFGLFRVPEWGDKLKHRDLIPADLRSVVLLPEIVWRSAVPRLPDNRDIEPGWYFLKANHGSRMNAQLSFPLDPAQRTALEASAARWLETAYGALDGEWWYTRIPRRIFLERSLSEGGPIVTWEFVMVNGQFAGVNAVKRIGGASHIVWMRPDFALHDFQEAAALAVVDPPPLIDRERLLGFVTELARPFNFVRIDLHLVDGRIYLSEFTANPANALVVLPPVVDELRTRLWTVLA